MQQKPSQRIFSISSTPLSPTLDGSSKSKDTREEKLERESTPADERNEGNNSTTLLRFIWERFCQISQRLILAKSTQQLLKQISDSDPCDEEKKQLLTALNNEISMLSVVKLQLEEAVSRCFARDIASRVVPPTLSLPITTATLSTSAKNDLNEQNSVNNQRQTSSIPSLSPRIVPTEIENEKEVSKSVTKRTAAETEEEKITSLKRKAPQQLLAYRNRIGPVSRKNSLRSKGSAHIVAGGENDCTIKEETETEMKTESFSGVDGKMKINHVEAEDNEMDAGTSATVSGDEEDAGVETRADPAGGDAILNSSLQQQPMARK